MSWLRKKGPPALGMWSGVDVERVVIIVCGTLLLTGLASVMIVLIFLTIRQIFR